MKKLVLLLFVVLGAARPGIGNCGPLLNEVMADPATDWDGDATYSFKNDEWVEIVNPDATPLDLTNCYLGDETGAFVYGFTGSLAPHGVVVVYGSDAVVWETANGESTTGLRLGNDGDAVTLWQVVSGSNVLVDTYAFNTNEAEDDRSTGRLPDGASTWALFDALNPYTGTTPPLGTGLAPTPGLPNDGSGGSTATTAATWGKVKQLFDVD